MRDPHDKEELPQEGSSFIQSFSDIDLDGGENEDEMQKADSAIHLINTNDF